MATPIEYGLIAGLIAIAVTAAAQSIPSPELPAGPPTLVASNVECTPAAYNRQGRMRLDCPGAVAYARLYTTSSELVIGYLTDRQPFTCDLYRDADAVCYST